MSLERLKSLKNELDSAGTPERAKAAQWFFKTGPGEYGEGDQFIGITVPLMRKIAYKYLDLDLDDMNKLLDTKVHEYRFVALEILVAQFERGDEKVQKRVFTFYIKNKKHINNWDLVDTSAGYIVGEYLHDKPKDMLYKLAASKNIWDRRIAMISTQAFIKRREFKDAIKIAEILVHDKHDLIQKAVGWMLREIGKVSLSDEEKFLKKYYRTMPRTMLRYAIERFPKEIRLMYLAR